MQWYLDSMVTWMGLLGLSSRQRKKNHVNKSFVFWLDFVNAIISHLAEAKVQYRNPQCACIRMRIRGHVPFNLPRQLQASLVSGITGLFLLYLARERWPSLFGLAQAWTVCRYVRQQGDFKISSLVTSPQPRCSLQNIKENNPFPRLIFV